MIEALEPLIAMIGVAIMIKVISDAIIKSKLINRGLVDENAKYLFTGFGQDRKKSDMKWGLVLLGIGAAIMIYQFSDITSEMMLGLMFLFAGIAFIAYNYIGKNGTGPNKDVTS